MKQSIETFLEESRIALNNAEAQTEIKTALEEIGYNATVLQEGKDLLAKAQQEFKRNIKEDNERSDAHRKWTQSFEVLDQNYRRHRKKAKIIFRQDPAVLRRLALDHPVPVAYIQKLNMEKTFYDELAANEELMRSLARLSLSAEDIVTAQNQVAIVEKNRLDYLKEKGESQDATKSKDKALNHLDFWMRDFHAVAAIALEDQPQLRESLSRLVRS